jgi:hypothetical protein
MGLGVESKYKKLGDCSVFGARCVTPAEWWDSIHLGLKSLPFSWCLYDWVWKTGVMQSSKWTTPMILKASSHLQVKILVTPTTPHKVGSVRIGVRYHPILQKQCLHKQLSLLEQPLRKKLEKSCLVL